MQGESSALLKPGSLSAFATALRLVAGEDAERNDSEAGVEALVAALTHPDPARRILALDASCQVAAARSEGLVMGMLSDADPNVRLAAISAAKRVASPRLVSCRIVALEDPAASVRRASRRVLESITSRRIELAESGDPASFRRQLGERRAWWERSRFSQLLAVTGVEGGSFDDAAHGPTDQ